MLTIDLLCFVFVISTEKIVVTLECVRQHPSLLTRLSQFNSEWGRHERITQPGQSAWLLSAKLLAQEIPRGRGFESLYAHKGLQCSGIITTASKAVNVSSILTNPITQRRWFKSNCVPERVRIAQSGRALGTRACGEMESSFLCKEKFRIQIPAVSICVRGRVVKALDLEQKFCLKAKLKSLGRNPVQRGCIGGSIPSVRIGSEDEW